MAGKRGSKSTRPKHRYQMQEKQAHHSMELALIEHQEEQLKKAEAAHFNKHDKAKAELHSQGPEVALEPAQNNAPHPAHTLEVNHPAHTLEVNHPAHILEVNKLAALDLAWFLVLIVSLFGFLLLL